MPEKPHATLLNRSEAASLIATNFAPQLNLLEQLANFGSNLVMRAYNSSNKNLEDVIVCAVLLKHLVTMIDATEIMLRDGAVHAAHLAARAAFEASLYAQWILLSDSENKAKHYYVANLRQERLWARRVLAGTQEKDDFDLAMKSLNFDLDTAGPKLVDEAKVHLANVNKILAQPAFEAIDKHFTKKKGKGKHDPSWHSVLGNESIRKIAAALQRLPEYDLFYAKGSQVTHAASYKDHVRLGAGKAHLKAVRNLEGLHLLLNFVFSLSIKTFGLVLQHYRPDELPNYWKTYKQEWRAPFLNVKEVKAG